jgi:hypothetical protein
VAPSNIATCRETCAATAGCVAVNYAHPGAGVRADRGARSAARARATTGRRPTVG